MISTTETSYKKSKSDDKSNENILNEFSLKEMNQKNFLIFPDFEKQTDRNEGSGINSKVKPGTIKLYLFYNNKIIIDV